MTPLPLDLLVSPLDGGPLRLDGDGLAGAGDERYAIRGGVPLLGIEPGEHDVQRLIYWCFLKCFWNEDWGHELNVLTNFDWHHPPYASRHTPEEVEGWCAEAGLAVLHLDVIESGISVRAQKDR